MLYDWILEYNAYMPRQEGLREALCTLGNGYFAIRGSAPESTADGIHYPGTYLAGGYNRLKSQINGKTVENEDLVNLPNGFFLTFRVENGPWFSLDQVNVLKFHQALDIKRGFLKRDVTFEDAQGHRTRLVTRRLVSIQDPHLAAQETAITAENWSGRLDIQIVLDGRVANTNVKRYQELSTHHLDYLDAHTIGENFLFLKTQTCQSELRIAQCVRIRICKDDIPFYTEKKQQVLPDKVEQIHTLNLFQGECVAVEQVMSLYTSRDFAISECGLAAQKAIQQAPDFCTLLARHAQKWRILWQHLNVGIDLEVSPETHHPLMVLRLHIFHLIQTISPNSIDLDIGVPARGWHGEAYRGHVFWDDLFIFPYINLRVPEIGRALLMYRYRRLAEARERAARAGYRGAMYPWQSGSSGREDTPLMYLNPLSTHWIWDYTHLQRHVNAAIAYNIWQYYQTTEDREFLSFYGGEMILEIARFWASIATYNPHLDRYEILGVVGPDEYHTHYPGSLQPGLNNNAYTNLMAVWTLRCALKVLDELPRDRRHELCELLGLRRTEIRTWDEISRKMRLVFHEDGIISQFEGYDQLEDLDWQDYLNKHPDLQRLDMILEAEGRSVNEYKVSKQADVLMLFYLFSSEELQELFERLGYPFYYETIPKNIAYYLKRTTHGSSLSRIVHSWVLARSDRRGSWTLFSEALESDVADKRGGTTREGIHLGAMAGSVDILQRCYTGMVIRQDILWLNPTLPDELKRLHLRVRYRGQSLDLDFKPDRITVRVTQSTAKKIRIGIKDRVYLLSAGESRTFLIKPVQKVS